MKPGTACAACLLTIELSEVGLSPARRCDAQDVAQAHFVQVTNVCCIPAMCRAAGFAP